MKLHFTLPPRLIAPLRPVKRLGRHHYFIALLVMLGGLAVAVYSVNDTLNAPSDESYRSELLKKTVGTKFNKTTQDTIDKIEALQRSSEQSQQNLPLPAGRINPFAE